ncbi:hypothetical protein BSLG_002312 [Batrachochytrium salamandrivorans]|nr:hypothetical protein BSLG_002312 [Batrachochytrium salamandrivorans]
MDNHTNDTAYFRTPQQKPGVLPEELLLRIMRYATMGCIQQQRLQDNNNDTSTDITDTINNNVSNSDAVTDASNDISHTTSNNKRKRKLPPHPLHAYTLVSRTWHRLASDILWRRVVLEDLSLASFVRGVLLSARFDIQQRIKAMTSSSSRSSSCDSPVYTNYSAALMVIAKRLAIVDAFELLDLANTDLPGLYEDSGLAAHMSQFSSLDSSDDDHLVLEDGDLGALQTSTIMNFLAPQSQSHVHVFLQQRQLLAQSRNTRRAPPLDPLPYGNGSLVRKLDIPSWGQSLALIPLAMEFLPKWNSVAFLHPPHGKEYIPTLRPNLIRSLLPIFSQLDAITVEDVDSDGWIPLLRAVSENCQNIRHLNLEAIPEKEQYTSSVGMVYLFESLPKLECIRMDGIPVGHKHFTPFGGDLDIKTLPIVCPNLRAVTLDYCDVSMKSFYTLWNDCKHLEFLGLAGLSQSSDALQLNLMPKPLLKTLRFVDCDVSDSLLEDVAKNAPNLDMLRVVFEDSESLKSLDITEELSDTTLFAIGRHCTHLRTLAISICRRMTSSGLIAILRNNSLVTLDFHKTPDSETGLLSDSFFYRIAPSLAHVKTINLYGQIALSEDMFISIINHGYLASLKSVCLNATLVSRRFLGALACGGCPLLERVSLIDCRMISGVDLVAFLGAVLTQSLVTMQHLKCIYTLEISSSSVSTGTDIDAFGTMRASTISSEISDLNISDLGIQNSPITDVTSDAAAKHLFNGGNGLNDIISKDDKAVPIAHRLVLNADMWFSDEKLDIFSLWAHTVRKGGCTM